MNRGLLSLIALLFVPLAAFAAVDRGEVLALTNEDRADAGLSSLARNALLDRAAQLKADDMADNGYYAHVSPDGKSPLYWIERVGYRYRIIGENLDVNATSAHSADVAWMGSTGHRANILRPEFTELGVGVAEGTYKGKKTTFVVQMFASPLPPAIAATPKPAPLPTPVAAPKPAPTNPLVESVKVAVAPISRPISEFIRPLSFIATTTDASASSTVVTSMATTTPDARLPLFDPKANVILLDPSQQPAYFIERPLIPMSPKPAPTAWRVRIDAFMDSFVTNARALLRFR